MELAWSEARVAHCRYKSVHQFRVRARWRTGQCWALPLTHSRALVLDGMKGPTAGKRVPKGLLAALWGAG
jgi:hypothetical protein